MDSTVIICGDRKGGADIPHIRRRHACAVSFYSPVLNALQRLHAEEKIFLRPSRRGLKAALRMKENFRLEGSPPPIDKGFSPRSG